MSGTSPEEGSFKIDEDFQLIADFEDPIISSEELLDTALNENLNNASYTINRYSLILSVESALAVETDDERVHELAHALMSAISSQSRRVVDELQHTEASDRLIKVILKFASKYGHESGIPTRVSRQGPDYWNDIQIDVLRRGRSGAVGMNYRLIVGREGETKGISVSLDSNMALVLNMLAAQEHAIDEFEETAVDQMDMSVFEDLQNQLEDISDMVEEYTEENGENGEEENDD